jgi:phosphatidylinositol phospholipase C, delta
LVSRVRGKITSGNDSNGVSSPPAATRDSRLQPPSASDGSGNLVRRGSNASAVRGKPKMSLALAALLVYTIGVKCRGLNKKETYAVEHMFSLSEKTANKFLRDSMADLIKHNRTHLVRIYPNGTRLSSSNYEPHRYWAAGTQLVAINWQTYGTQVLPVGLCCCTNSF